jgi:hypothetical protein
MGAFAANETVALWVVRTLGYDPIWQVPRSSDIQTRETYRDLIGTAVGEAKESEASGSPLIARFRAFTGSISTCEHAIREIWPAKLPD